LLLSAPYHILPPWRQAGRLWQGGRDPKHSIPALYIPLVAGPFVTAIALGSFGCHELAKLAFDAGFFAWLAIDSVVLHRFLNAPELSHQLRPTFCVQLAPSAVGSVAYRQAHLPTRSCTACWARPCSRLPSLPASFHGLRSMDFPSRIGRSRSEPRHSRVQRREQLVRLRIRR